MTSQLALFAATPSVPGRRAYHVRSHATVAEVAEGERRARAQDALVLRYLRACGGRATPSEVWAALSDDHGFHGPLTSVRRALTNLTREGLLVHHPEDRRPGPYGAAESTWEARG